MISKNRLWRVFVMKKWWWLIAVLLVCTSLLLVPAASASTVPAAAQTTYVVQPGDTLFRIALRFGTTVQAIAQANHIVNPDLIYVGQVLIIPTGGSPPPAPPPTPEPPPGGQTLYTVQPGDTLTAIALRFGTTVAAIAQANNITNLNLIYVGQVLIIPVGGGGNPPPPPAPPPPGGNAFELGGQTQSLGHVAQMNQAGMSWVKFQHKWTAGDDPSAVAGLIQQGHANGFKVLLSVTGATAYPAPNSIDFTAYVQFLAGVASLGANAPDAIEVWNEMNIDFEWPAGQISPSSYVNNMLAPAYIAIKTANQNIGVISGALAPTGFDNGTNAWADNRYLAGMAAAGAVNYTDCVGVHHNAGATSPSASSGHPGGSHYSWYFMPTLNLYYNTFGGARQLCFTELGYLSGEGFSGLPPNFSWASGTSVGEHAQWLAEAASLSANNSRVRLIIVYNVDFTSYDPNGDPQAGYAMIRPDGSCPACDTLNAVTGGR
jgi:LysM repeat protein